MSFGSGLFLALTLAVAAAATGCATATPVDTTPIGPEDASKLRAALMGSCNVTRRQLPSRQIAEVTGIRMTFTPDGRLTYLMGTFEAVNQTYQYRLEGRNIFSDGPYRSMRVDDWKGGELKLFLYEIGETFFCKKL